jgi:putative PIN family toxin of toxin-antitoxin system
MIRVVLDTNILISALLSPSEAPAQVFLRAILDSDTQLCVSGEIYTEYEEVMRRPRLRRSESEVADALRAIRDRGYWVRPTVRIQACVDPDDDIFLECAVAAGADYLVTGNLKHFPKEWACVAILTARVSRCYSMIRRIPHLKIEMWGTRPQSEVFACPSFFVPCPAFATFVARDQTSTCPFAHLPVDIGGGPSELEEGCVALS